LTLVLLGCNGWNSVVDNNAEKSVALEASYGIPELVSGHILYFGGVERATGAPEGQPWRHLLDAYVTWSPLPALTLNLHGDAGFEQNAFGMSSWIAGALSARLRALPWLYLAARADVFFEEVAEDAGGRAAPIFWPSPWVASQTATVDLRPDDHVSFRVEYRHDHAGDPMYFEGEAAAPNSRSQDTVTLGMTGWF
jgi:hypothetical protein